MSFPSITTCHSDSVKYVPRHDLDIIVISNTLGFFKSQLSSHQSPNLWFRYTRNVQPHTTQHNVWAIEQAKKAPWTGQNKTNWSCCVEPNCYQYSIFYTILYSYSSSYMVRIGCGYRWICFISSFLSVPIDFFFPSHYLVVFFLSVVAKLGWIIGFFGVCVCDCEKDVSLMMMMMGCFC